MENSIDILNELKAISPVIAGIEKRNVFTVPADYFENLGTAVLMNVREEMGGLPGSIEPLMQVPQGYFESLAGNILNRIKAEHSAATELKTLSPMLYSIQNENVFAVPQGYFESLADNILNRIKAGHSAATELKTLSPMLYSIQNENVFTVPQGYFESLADNILNRIKAGHSAATELKTLSPMLYSIQNENVFTVPQGYFESLPAAILAKVQPQQVKVVAMQRRTVTTILKYAIAAVFTGVMALGVYQFSGGGSKKMELPGYVIEGKQIKNVDEELAKISDDDIIKYLQANGTDIDAALVANKMDETELPSQEDYLTDDKALDKYLDNIDLNDLKN